MAPRMSSTSCWMMFSMACITEAAIGFPNASGTVPECMKERGTLRTRDDLDQVVRPHRAPGAAAHSGHHSSSHARRSLTSRLPKRGRGGGGRTVERRLGGKLGGKTGERGTPIGPR